ncbi:metallo-beta-lactamase superfamily protein [Candidatus Endolissoclinum faulkneri L2]|uniref:Metallo-beta-lactamase superfamily protein n=1 Tax=Candidatus Endolissoclinum faulkneri L2 TaxID=1193729 RepID=K7YRV3_9PROT|nr:MBL fold metallo-hydrolase [Candidatus Endolissoclinum faulkneri]AFX99279.1 metallo-beta-lactamase superfamily protein [Candidatus Endolissoclinum faulkneri L2]
MKTDIDYIYGNTLPNPGTAMEVSPGIRWIRMPLPFALDHVNLFLLDDGIEGWVLVDTGLASKTTQDLWELILANELCDKHISRILITHFHPDHIGNAGWLCKRTGAQLYMSRTEWLSARITLAERQEDFQEDIQNFYSLTGISDLSSFEVNDFAAQFHRIVSPVPPLYRRIREKTSLVISGKTWTPILSEGHSPEHICLYCSEGNILIGGDFLLPQISPNVSVWWNEPEVNPLADYIQFLENLNYMQSSILVLPAHELPYRGLQKRCSALLAHHKEQLQLVLEACSLPSTVLDVTYKMFKRQFDPNQLSFAIGESLAHLNYLMGIGKIERNLDASGFWRYKIK